MIEENVMNEVATDAKQNLFFRLWWLRNFLFGLFIAVVVAVVGLGLSLWRVDQIGPVVGLIVVSCFIFLPVYANVIKSLR